jgi:hypothetical protein
MCPIVQPAWLRLSELELGKNIAPRVVSTIEARSGKAVEKIAGG